jgi:hypothetical protein
MRSINILSVVAFCAVLFGGATWFASRAHSETEPMEPLPVTLPASHPPVAPGGGYVGAQSCAECHPTAYRHWQDSQHAKAMLPATEQTVLGDFKDASFTHAGVTSTLLPPRREIHGTHRRAGGRPPGL